MTEILGVAIFPRSLGNPPSVAAPAAAGYNRASPPPPPLPEPPMFRSPAFHFAILLTLLAAPALRAAEPVLKPGDRVAIIGDSITEQKLYSKYVECYLLA